MIEPNCDMPWEVYLDWLQDQGNEDLRFIDPFSLINVGVMFLGYSKIYREDNEGSGMLDFRFSGEGFAEAPHLGVGWIDFPSLSQSLRGDGN
jgi:hypothetical protein